MFESFVANFSWYSITWLPIGMVLLTCPLAVGRYRRLPPSLRYLALLVGFDALMEITCSVFFNIIHSSNLFLFPFITVGELLLLALAYRQVLQSATFNRVVPWVLGLFGAYAVFETILELHTIRYAVSLGIISDLALIGLAGLYFRKLLNELQVERLQADPFFWVSVALIGHSLGDLLITLSTNYLAAHYSLQLQRFLILGVRNIFNFLLYASYFLALAMRPLPAKSLGVQPG